MLAAVLACGSDTATKPAPVDFVPPTVSLTSPLSGSATGILAITANAHDDQGVGSVKFFVNGLAYGGLDVTAPYTAQWSSTTAGNYTFGATAFDRKGNSAQATPVTVTYVP
jgi:chitinase